MKSGICPKCGARDVRSKHNWGHRGFLAVNFWMSVNVIHYVCASCGYLEDYVRESDLATLARQWPRVGLTGKAKPVAVDPDAWER